MAAVRSDALWKAFHEAGLLPQDGSQVRSIVLVAEAGQPLRLTVDCYAGDALVRTVSEFVDGKSLDEVDRVERPA